MCREHAAWNVCVDISRGAQRWTMAVVSKRKHHRCRACSRLAITEEIPGLSRPVVATTAAVGRMIWFVVRHGWWMDPSAREIELAPRYRSRFRCSGQAGPNIWPCTLRRLSRGRLRGAFGS